MHSLGTGRVMSLSPASIQPSPITESALNHAGYLTDIGTFSRFGPLLHRHQGFEILIPFTGVAEVFYGGWREKLLPGEACIGPADVPHGAEGSFDRAVIHFNE